MSVQAPTSPAADVLRSHLLFAAGVDPASWGIRPDGPLDWTPEPPDVGQRLAPVAIARDAHTARQRVTELYRRHRELRAVGRFWRACP